MIRRGQRAVSAAAAAVCLVLCACGTGSSPAEGAGGSGPASAGPAGSAPRSTGTAGRFCRKASSFMGKIPPAPTGHAGLARARANLGTVLRSTVEGFTDLRAEGPPSLRGSLSQIVSVYQSDERSLGTAGSITQLSAAMVKHNVAAATAFEQVLNYIAANCR